MIFVTFSNKLEVKTFSGRGESHSLDACDLTESNLTIQYEGYYGNKTFQSEIFIHEGDPCGLFPIFVIVKAPPEFLSLHI